mgnify:FL=1|jgi:hypothetical protein
MSLLSEVKVFDLPTQTATKILKEYIEKDTGRKVKSIKFVLGNQMVGYGMNESSEAYLRSIEVVFEDVTETKEVKEPAKNQYYYRNSTCEARSSTTPDCKCWHDEGTGPFPDARRDETTPCGSKYPSHWRSYSES